MTSGSDLQKQAAKTFWKKPEGTTGKVVLGAVAIGGGLLVYKYLPILLEWVTGVLENTLYAVGLGALLIAVTAPIWHPGLRTLVVYMFRSLMKAVTGWFVEIDPIGIIKNYIEDMRRSLGNMDTQLENLNGHIVRLRTIIMTNAKSAEQNLRQAGQAIKTEKKKAFILHSKQAGRLEKSNLSLQELLTRLETLHKVITKLRETSDTVIQDMEGEVFVKEQEYEALKAGYSAFKSAVSVMRGDPDSRALFDQAMEHLADNAASKAGEMEQFLNVSRGFIESVDLQQGVFEQEALERLAQMDQQAEQILLGNDAAAYNTASGIGLGTRQAVTQQVDGGVDDFFKPRR